MIFVVFFEVKGSIALDKEKTTNSARKDPKLQEMNPKLKVRS